jgi:hypothetical protein
MVFSVRFPKPMANLPGIKAFFDAIDELVSAEQGENADGGQPR